MQIYKQFPHHVLNMSLSRPSVSRLWECAHSSDPHICLRLLLPVFVCLYIKVYVPQPSPTSQLLPVFVLAAWMVHTCYASTGVGWQPADSTWMPNSWQDACITLQALIHWWRSPALLFAIMGLISFRAMAIAHAARVKKGFGGETCIDSSLDGLKLASFSWFVMWKSRFVQHFPYL